MVIIGLVQIEVSGNENGTSDDGVIISRNQPQSHKGSDWKPSQDIEKHGVGEWLRHR